MSMKSVTVTQMYEDKLCIIDFACSRTFCTYMNATSEHERLMKAKILGESSKISMYQSIIPAIPVTIASLFIGPWVDKHFKALKFMFLMAAFGSSLETIALALNAINFDWRPNLMLLAYIPTAIAGSPVHIFMAAGAYIPKTTVEKLRPIRYALLDLAIYLGIPLGTYVGGVLIETSTLKTEDSLHNYFVVFFVAFCCQVFAFLFILFIFNEESKSGQRTSNVSESEQAVGHNNTVLTDQETRENEESFAKDLFNIENVKQTLKTFFKQRADGKRRQLLLMTAAMYVLGFMTIAPGLVLFQFTQRVFSWNATVYSDVNAIGSVLSNIAVAIAVYVFVGKLNVNDIFLAIVGSISSIFLNLVKGTILTPVGFFISIFIGSLSGFGLVGARSYLSRIVAHDELAQVFCVLASLEPSAQLLAGIVTSSLFDQTVAHFPGTVFQVLASLTFIPMIIFMYIDIYIQSIENLQVP